MQPSIPFGKHKDTPLPNVPTAYLEWCVKEFDPTSRPELCAAIANELRKRKNSPYFKRQAEKKKATRHKAREERKEIDWENVPPPSCTLSKFKAESPFGPCDPICPQCVGK